MKLLTTTNKYTRANCELNVSDDLKTVSAWSYDWWQFVATDDVGNVFFNDYSYSNTTNSQQSDVSSKLRVLGVTVNCRLHNTSRHFGCGIENVLQGEIKELKGQIRELIKAIKTPRSHKRKNAERRDDIQTRLYRIKDLRRIKNEYLNKKPIPVKRRKIKSCLELAKCRWTKKLHKGNARNIRMLNKRFFKKHNGKIQIEALNAVFKTYEYDWRGERIPESLEKTCAIFDVALEPNKVTLLRYSHAKDLENMIPDLDDADYKKLKAKALKFKGNNDLNALHLDKLHQVLINKVNRKTYTPKEPVYFSMSESIQKLEGIKHLELIKTDKELRSEGRRQGHCIGSKMYMDKMHRGYHALNFKGYTFFLTPDAQLIETHGKHNAPTPENIKNELTSLLAS